MSLLPWCLMPRLSTCRACQCPHPILTSSILDKAPVKDRGPSGRNTPAHSPHAPCSPGQSRDLPEDPLCARPGARVKAAGSWP